MTISESDLEVEIETWSDPGDGYPNGAASSPLPSYQYASGVGGTVTIQLQPEDSGWFLLQGLDTSKDADVVRFLSENNEAFDALADIVPPGVKVTQWRVERRLRGGGNIVVSVADCDTSGYEVPRREDDWDLPEEWYYDEA